MEKYFLILDGIKSGPFSLDQLFDMSLVENTLVWKKGLTDWIKLSDLPEYKEYIPPPLPNIRNLEQVVNENIKNENNESLNNLEVQKKPEKIIPILDQKKYGGFWIRFLAFILDFLILLFITTIVWAIFQIPIKLNTQTFITERIFIFKNPVSILFGWFYYALFECSKFQATPGKAIAGIIVTGENLLRIDFGKASGRYFSKLLSAFIFGIGFIMIAFSKRKQGLHDRLVGTLILRNEKSEIKGRKQSWGILLSTLILFIISLFIPANIVNQETPDTIKSRSLDTERLEPNSEILSLTFAGLSLKYPNHWNLEKKELKKEVSYQINFKKDGDDESDIMSITILNLKSDCYKMLQNSIELMRNEQAYEDANIKPIVNTSFNGIEAYSADFEVTFRGIKFFGNMVSFGNEEKTILILKQSDTTEKLHSIFQTIEASIGFN